MSPKAVTGKMPSTVGCLMASYGGNLLCRLGEKLHATLSPAAIVAGYPLGRRPLRIHELRKFTGYANVTGEYRRDIRLIILAIFSEFIDSQRTDE